MVDNSVPEELLPTNDLLFEKLFMSEEHKAIPQGFIADFFKIAADLDQIRLVRPYLIHLGGEAVAAREAEWLNPTEDYPPVRFAADLADGIYEFQLRSAQHYPKRSLYHMSTRVLYHYGLNEAQPDMKATNWPYGCLQRVYSLDVTQRQYGDEPHAFHAYGMGRWSNDEFVALPPDILRMCYLDLTKTLGLTDRQLAWCNFFKTGLVDAGAPAYLTEAAALIQYQNLTDAERRLVKIAEQYKSWSDPE
ncbi:MAG: Rpn family recombination-promoting nuclease/putative transposase [Bifidobacteriaceae bacterium]|jgi:hypothetical protein|nr:Rpn family recombination-promoting nuclease/putative transposase [Bifidobacteriaceae bacterium]